MSDTKSPTNPDPNYLPDNLPECHNLITSLRNQVKSLEERVAELEKQLSRRNRAAFGKKSAKVDSTLLTGTGKAIHSQTADELDAEKDRLNIVSVVNQAVVDPVHLLILKLARSSTVLTPANSRVLAVAKRDKS